MKLYTHNRTPKPKNSKLTIFLFVLCYVLTCLIFGLMAFLCFYYAQSIIGSVSVILIYLVLTAIIAVPIIDMEKAYVEIKESEIYVVDYFFGIKKEKYIALSDITSAEIKSGRSLKVKGHRYSNFGIEYIVFMKDDKYLFKIIASPETEEIFKQYIKTIKSAE